MSIIRILVSFYRNGEENAFERHRSRVLVDVVKQCNVPLLKKHPIDFLGLKEQVKSH